jgi:hypothetical protein
LWLLWLPYGLLWLLLLFVGRSIDYSILLVGTSCRMGSVGMDFLVVDMLEGSVLVLEELLAVLVLRICFL